MRLIKLEKSNLEYLKAVRVWDNEYEIRHFLRPNFSECELKDLSIKELQKVLKKSKYAYMIEYDNKLIGYATIDVDFLFLSRQEKTAWISLCIGKKDYRGKGIGEQVVKLLERKVKKLKIDRIEVGIFAFNERAYKLYKKLGYNEVKILKDFTYYNNKWHNDIRMEKYLT